MKRTVEHDSPKQSYEAFAPVYDDFNRDYLNERWTGRLLAKAQEAGLEGDRLLDVACGTGLSFTPMLARGWQVTACDISPAMLEVAASKAGDDAKLVTADMRELPSLGEFDLVWALNDALNYLLSLEELEATLAGMRRNLALGGVALFDANTVAAYRAFWSGETVVEEKGRRMIWKGRESPEAVRPGELHEARFEAEGEPGLTHVHRQRHFPEAEVRAAIEASGLRCAHVFGDREGTLHTDLDEEVHTKAIYLCTG